MGKFTIPPDTGLTIKQIIDIMNDKIKGEMMKIDKQVITQLVREEVKVQTEHLWDETREIRDMAWRALRRSQPPTKPEPPCKTCVHNELCEHRQDFERIFNHDKYNGNQGYFKLTCLKYVEYI